MLEDMLKPTFRGHERGERAMLAPVLHNVPFGRAGDRLEDVHHAVLGFVAMVGIDLLIHGFSPFESDSHLVLLTILVKRLS